MRTLRTLILCLSLPGIAFAQSTRATQTIRLSIQPPVRLSAAAGTLTMDLRSNGSGLTGRAQDRLAIHARHTRRLSAALRESLPEGTKLIVRLGTPSRTSSNIVELTDTARSVDMTEHVPSGPSVEQRVEYHLVSETSALAPDTRTIVYTLTD